MTKGVRGLRGLLRQFNEAALSPWQRDLLRERLLILDWYDRNEKNETRAARAFETSRGHVHKLVKAREEEGLGGLIPKRTGPPGKRGFNLNSEERQEIERFARMFPDWGHKKLHMFLHGHSTSTLYRYLAKKGLLVRNRCPGFHKKPKPRSAWKVVRKKLPKDYAVYKPGDLVVLDSIVEFVDAAFNKLYFITCVDVATRIGFALVTKNHSSKAAKALLGKMEEVLQTKIKAVLTDNGSEFLAYFHKACKDQGIEHFFTRPRTPKDNAICERFNLTLQQGLYWRVDLTSPIYKINEVLADWLVEYNCLRPHESLNMRPPVAHYFHLFYSPRPTPEVYSKLWS